MPSSDFTTASLPYLKSSRIPTETDEELEMHPYRISSFSKFYNKMLQEKTFKIQQTFDFNDSLTKGAMETSIAANAPSNQDFTSVMNKLKRITSTKNLVHRCIVLKESRKLECLLGVGENQYIKVHTRN